MKYAALLFALLLAACASGTPPAPPQPTPAFTASWTAPSIGLGLACTQDEPPVCTGTSPWTTFVEAAVPGGLYCIDPGPNACYSSDGTTLTVTAVLPGLPIISRQTFPASGTLSLQVNESATCTASYCYAGPVIYNGESNYRGEYYCNCAGNGLLQIAVFSTTKETVLPGDYAPGSFHELWITYKEGVFTYLVDRIPMLTETSGSLGPDSTFFANDPHVALWQGGVTARVGAFQVFTSP